VAIIDNLIMKEEKVPFCFSRKRRAMKNGRFKNIPDGYRDKCKKEKGKRREVRYKNKNCWNAVVPFSQWVL
jgi:hypothetical protein